MSRCLVTIELRNAAVPSTKGMVNDDQNDLVWSSKRFATGEMVMDSNALSMLLTGFVGGIVATNAWLAIVPRKK